MDLIQNAICTIPEDVTVDSKFLAESEHFGMQADSKAGITDMETCDSLDKMMCQIVDGMN